MLKENFEDDKKRKLYFSTAKNSAKIYRPNKYSKLRDMKIKDLDIEKIDQLIRFYYRDYYSS